jgi:acyl dehydratase
VPPDADLALNMPALPRAPAFESLAPGHRLPELLTPPVSTAHVMRWCAAVENWHRIHYDRAFAVEHEGLPDVVIPGTWKQQLLYRLLKDWAGPDGWVLELEYQFRGLDVPGESLAATGLVTATFAQHGYGFVECSLLLRSSGRELPSATGRGLVVLPLHQGPAVPYPFPPELMPEPRREPTPPND